MCRPPIWCRSHCPCRRRTASSDRASWTRPENRTPREHAGIPRRWAEPAWLGKAKRPIYPDQYRFYVWNVVFPVTYSIVWFWCFDCDTTNGRSNLGNQLGIKAIAVLVKDRFPVVRFRIDCRFRRCGRCWGDDGGRLSAGIRNWAGRFACWFDGKRIGDFEHVGSEGLFDKASVAAIDFLERKRMKHRICLLESCLYSLWMHAAAPFRPCCPPWHCAASDRTERPLSEDRFPCDCPCFRLATAAFRWAP